MKWYRTYTEGSRPEPIFIEASESSVYDLKEHPDFKFRPGAIVIRYFIFFPKKIHSLVVYFLYNKGISNIIRKLITRKIFMILSIV